MLRHYLLWGSFILCLFVISLFKTNYTGIEKKAVKLASLNKQAIRISSINPNDTIFSDLTFLQKCIGNAEIVMLGEQNHYLDGSTFNAKARLIKFLHQRMDFDVIIYEAGLYDTYLASLDFALQRDIHSFSKGLWSFWVDNEECQQTLNYIYQSRENHPIEFAGCDIQFSGKISSHTRDSLLSGFFERKNISRLDYPIFYSIMSRLSEYNNGFGDESMTLERKDSLLVELSSLIKNLEGHINFSWTDSVYLHYIQGIKNLFYYSWKMKYLSNERFAFRDSLMASNIIWLRENKFCKNKIIVWAANMHVSYGDLDSKQFKFKTMGTYIKDRYDTLCYVINFTSALRSDGKTANWTQTSNKSVEYLLHEGNMRYAYIDFKTLPPISFLNGDVVLRCNQDLNLNGKWCKLTDGIFFIDTMFSPKIITTNE